MRNRLFILFLGLAVTGLGVGCMYPDQGRGGEHRRDERRSEPERGHEHDNEREHEREHGR